MINNDMRFYKYFLYKDKDAYGQPQLTQEAQGIVKMAINITSQSIQDNANYSGANYVGITRALLDDSFVIQYGEEKLKVLYVNPKGRYKLAYMVKL